MYLFVVKLSYVCSYLAEIIAEISKHLYNDNDYKKQELVKQYCGTVKNES